MKPKNVALCLFVSFCVLAICAALFDLPKRVLVAISVSSLIYTFAQTLKSDLELRVEETKTQVDAFNIVGDMNLTPAWIMFMKRYARWLNPSKLSKAIDKIIVVLECVSFVVLLVGFVVPIPFLESGKISDVASVLSFALLFLSVWQVEKYAERKSQWEDIQLFSMALKDSSQTIDK